MLIGRSSPSQSPPRPAASAPFGSQQGPRINRFVDRSSTRGLNPSNGALGLSGSSAGDVPELFALPLRFPGRKLAGRRKRYRWPAGRVERRAVPTNEIYGTNSLATLNPTSSYRALSVALARTAGRRDFPVLNQDPPRTALAWQPAPARAEPSDGAVR
jgi:hypothetical protein